MTGRGRRTSLRIVALLLLAAAAGCFLVALRDDAPAAAEPTPVERLPLADSALLSARRAPFLFAEPVARVRLGRAVAEAARGADRCMGVTDPRTGTRLAALDVDRSLAPASTLKLPTGAAAISALGPDYRFTTRALLDGRDLFLVGGGDPVLSTPAYEQGIRANPSTRTNPVTRLAALADAVVASRVTAIGTIVADDTRHEDLRFLPAWRPTYTSDIGPLGALTVDDGTFGGQRVPDPALNAATQLRLLLEARGIAVAGVAHGTAPGGAREIAKVESPPVADLVAAMITSSDNDTAEMLVREIGVARGGSGSTEAGTAAATRELEQLGVTTTGIDMKDGSGLARENRLTCVALLDVLDLPSDPKFAALDRGLAVAGRTGTLVGRGAGLDGVLRAKTGHIDGVAGLAGIVDDADHLRFAYLANGSFSASEGRATADDFARIVARYPEVPADSELVPAP